MRSKSILFSIVVSAIVLCLATININYRIPLKVNYRDLTEATKRQVTCLAENIYFEAGHEPLSGKQAVAFVTINRVQSGYSKDICGVVHQKSGGTCQFSWLCDKNITSKRLTIRDSSLYNEVRELAVDMILNRDFKEDVTQGATYYHADYVNPQWKLEKVKKIGRHIFYRNQMDKIDRNRSFYE
jgi:spore germination cell wall hydrolase CwlJ-like protein